MNRNKDTGILVGALVALYQGALIYANDFSAISITFAIVGGIIAARIYTAP